MDCDYSSTFKVKWTRFRGHTVPFLLQNSDGECPLICLANVLFLKRKIQLPRSYKDISFNNLCSYICSTLPHANAEWVTSILDSLRKGLLFNCRFDSSRALLAPDPDQLFMSFKIPLKHGWIPDPIVYGPLTNLNYDQLLEKLAIYQSKSIEVKREDSNLTTKFEKLSLNEVKNGDSSNSVSLQPKDDEKDQENVQHVEEEKENVEGDSKETSEKGKENGLVEYSDTKKSDKESFEGETEEFGDHLAEMALEFLERYATQITEYGIKVLKNEMDDGSLVALYRNNHFLVATLHNGEIFTLVTDSSFYGHHCIWESLETYEYFDENFEPYIQTSRIKPKKKPTFLEKVKRAFTPKSRRR